MARWNFDPQVEVTVLGAAETEEDHHEDFGCGLQGPASRAVRKAGKALAERIRGMGKTAAEAEAEALVRWLEATPAYDVLCDGKKTRGGRRVLAFEVVFPDPKRLVPRVLHLRRGTHGIDTPLRAREWPAAADLVHLLARGATDAELAAIGKSTPTLRDLLSDLREGGWLMPARDPLAFPPGGSRLLFAGHNTALIASAKTRVLVDPWFRPAHPSDPPGYRPLQPADLGPVDAVAITHSHGDHFHLGSLLALGRETTILVPAISRESLFSTDLAARLRALGFHNVVPMKWWESRTIGDVEIRALPFLGEQPTGGEGIYPDLWNEGNTWLVRAPGLSAAFFADAGRDVRGDMKDVAARVEKESGAVDLLFTGIRGFRLKPVFYPFTTLDAFLVNVPLAQAGVTQQLMSDAKDALALGRAMGAASVVPYADGGAPWYWRDGMGPPYPGYPTYPGFREAPATPADDPDSDPFPERLEEEADAEGEEDSPEALVLRPGDLLRARRDGTDFHRFEPFAWPYDPEE